MAKTISVDELTYSNVVSVAGKLMMKVGKPISLGYTVRFAVSALDEILDYIPPEGIERLKQMLKDISSAAQLDQLLEEEFKKLIGGQPQQSPPQTGKPSDKTSTAYIQ